MELTPPSIAKITRPTALHLLNRPRLFAALDQARHRAAAWVTAPPGFGKTSLASSYVAHPGFDCVWYCRNVPAPQNANAAAYNPIQTLIGLHAGNYLNAEQHARLVIAKDGSSIETH